MGNEFSAPTLIEAPSAENGSNEGGRNTPMPRGKRLRSYWEPIYDPNDGEGFPYCDWDFTHKTGANHSTCRAEELWKSRTSNRGFKFQRNSFVQCDFAGDFTVRRVVFVNCVFERCDFGFSKWKGAKFTKCRFIQCSFSMATFEASEFRDCDWEKIYFSGNETNLAGTIITNPSQFIQAAWTNLDKDVLSSKQTNPRHQKMRLEETKAVVSKAVFNNLSTSGDDDSYYEAIKIYLNQSSKAKISLAWYKITSHKSAATKVWCFILLLIYALELMILNVFGHINKWGSSIARPALLGMVLMLAFSVIYYAAGVRNSFWSSLMASVDITLLIGYTKHAARGVPQLHQALFTINMLIGLVWYAVFVPTVINRVSRVR